MAVAVRPIDVAVTDAATAPVVMVVAVMMMPVVAMVSMTVAMAMSVAMSVSNSGASGADRQDETCAASQGETACDLLYDKHV